MLSQIIALLCKYGYHLLNEERTGIYIHETPHIVYGVTISKCNSKMQIKDYECLQKQIEFLMISRYQKSVQILHLIVAENGMFDDQTMQIVKTLSNVWMVARDTGKIYIFENQLQDFDGLYEYLSDELKNICKNPNEISSFTITSANMVIVILNILAFLSIIIINGTYEAVYDSDIMLQMGAMNYDAVMAGHWYQIVTSMFLHFGLSHLFNNMILLFYAGCELERRIGKISYLIIYFCSGITGNIASLIYYKQYEGVSAGASGAIFGVIGALFVTLLLNDTKTENLTPGRLLFLAAITIYYGMTVSGVDNAAHIGGLIGGIIIGFLLSKISQYDKLE